LKLSPLTLNSNPTPSLKDLSILVEDDLVLLEKMMQDSLAHTLPMLQDVGFYILKSGGKRMRPLLTFLCAKILGEVQRSHLKAALCIELIHNATLLHDDVMDDSPLRRGKPVANKVWTYHHSILTGDFFLCRALEILSELRNWPLIDHIQACARKVIEGQALELQGSSLSFSEQEKNYLCIIDLKTASLFEAAAMIPSLLRGKSDPYNHACQVFGHSVGMCFQMMDDILDYWGDFEKIGKKPGQDFREKKVTMPIILAHQKGTSAQKKFLEGLFHKAEKTDTDFEKLKAHLDAQKVLNASLDTLKIYIKKAEESLNQFPDHPFKEALQGIIQVIYTQPLKK